jgi:hypothetical protein
MHAEIILIVFFNISLHLISAGSGVVSAFVAQIVGPNQACMTTPRRFRAR